MGMDVYGRDPVNATGEYFRNNVWWWRPLADYCCEIAPEVTSKCEHWQTNDGAGLSREDSLELARILQEKVDSGDTRSFKEIRDAEMNALPDKPCYICSGTGKRLLPPNVGPGQMPCNGCNATGRVRPDETMYPFTVENVMEFIEFLKNCGGFRIC